MLHIERCPPPETTSMCPPDPDSTICAHVQHTRSNSRFFGLHVTPLCAHLGGSFIYSRSFAPRQSVGSKLYNTNKHTNRLIQPNQHQHHKPQTNQPIHASKALQLSINMPATNYSKTDAKVSKVKCTAIESKTERRAMADKQAKNTSSSKHQTEECKQIDEDAELVASLGDYVCY
jgi:hypothetical protein